MSLDWPELCTYRLYLELPASKRLVLHLISSCSISTRCKASQSRTCCTASRRSRCAASQRLVLPLISSSISTRCKASQSRSCCTASRRSLCAASHRLVLHLNSSCSISTCCKASQKLSFTLYTVSQLVVQHLNSRCKHESHHLSPFLHSCTPSKPQYDPHYPTCRKASQKSSFKLHHFSTCRTAFELSLQA
jgi:hypothetical protein